MKRNCPLCGLQNRALLYTVPGSGQRIFQCECRMIYAESEPFDYGNDSIYSQYETNDSIRHCIEVAGRVAKLFPNRKDKIIDIGCATGTLLECLRFKGYSNIRGIDPCPAAVNNVKHKGLNARVGSLETAIEHVDLAILSHVLEHVTDPVRGLIVLNAKNVYIEVPDASRYLATRQSFGAGFNIEHINHFTPDTLVRMGQRAKLNIEMLGKGIFNYVGRIYPVPIIWATFSRSAFNMVAYVKWVNKEFKKFERKVLGELDGYQRLIIWGVGQTAQHFIGTEIFSGKVVVSAVDSNPVFHDREFQGVLVQSPEILRGCDPSIPIFVPSHNSKREIVEAIRKMGLTNKVITL